MAACAGDRLCWSSHNMVLANRLHRLYIQSCLLDVRLVCDQAHIYAHKAVLAAGSRFFWERLQSLGSGMVELHMSTANLGTLITPSDLKAVVEYMYCGELLVPHHRLPHVLALVQSLQVFGFQSDPPEFITGPEPQYITHSELGYAPIEAQGVTEILTDTSHVALESAMESGGVVTHHSSIPLLALKPQDQSVLQDPPKYSEPLKLDTNIRSLGSSANMSFSELCTAPGIEADVSAIQCSQVKNNIPSIFESSVLEDTNTSFKSRLPDCGQVYNKTDGEVTAGAILNLGEEHIPRGDQRLTSVAVTGGNSKEEPTQQHEPQPPSGCSLEGEDDYSTVGLMLLEALAGDAADAPSPTVVDVDSILLSDDAKMTVSPRWLRSRRSPRTTADSKVRLKVKDSIGGVSLQDTSQRESANASSSLPSTNPGEDENQSGSKGRWMVALPQASTVPLIAKANGTSAYHIHTSIQDTTSLLHTQTSTDSSSLLTQATPLQPPPSASTSLHLTAPFLSQSSSPNTVPILTQSLGSNASPFLTQPPVLNTAPLFTQSSLSFTPYIQPSVLSPAVLNQPDISQVHAVPTIPLQAMSAQPLSPGVQNSYSCNNPYLQPSNPNFTQSSHSSVHSLTESTPSSVIPFPESAVSPVHLSSESPVSIKTSLSSDMCSRSVSMATVSLPHPSLSSISEYTQSDIAPISTAVILQPSMANGIGLSQPSVSTPLLINPAAPCTPHFTQPSFSTNTLAVQTSISAVPLSASTLVSPQSLNSGASVPRTNFSSVVSTNSHVSASSSPTVPVSSCIPHIGGRQVAVSSRTNPLCTSTTSVTLNDFSYYSESSPYKSTQSVSTLDSYTVPSSMLYTTSATSSSSLSTSPSSKSFIDSKLSTAESLLHLDTCLISSVASLVSPSGCTITTTVATTEKSTTASITTTVPSMIKQSPNDSKHLGVTQDNPRFSTSEQVAEENNSSEKVHQCSKCPQTYKKLDSLTLHLWEEHEIGTVAKCQLCEFSSPLHSSLVKHASSHITKENNICAICKKTFKTRATVKTHLKFHRGEEVMYKCELCSSMYSQKYNLTKHLASRHRCDADGRPLTESLSCPSCSYTTLAEYKLKAHMVRRHTVDKPFKCSQCSYSTTEKTALSKHLRTHTKERPYVCETCGFHAPTLSSLWRHRRSHTAEKPYECEECGQQYADSKRLKDHLLKHRNLKPFMCHLCGYTCRRKDNLQTHLRKVHKLDDQKGSSNASKALLPRSGKIKRVKGGRLGQPASLLSMDAPETSIIQNDCPSSTSDNKSKLGPEESKLQVWTEHSYDSRAVDSSSEDGVMLGRPRQLVSGCIIEGGITTEAHELMPSQAPFTTTLTTPALQGSAGNSCMVVGAPSTLQVSYLLPVNAPPEASITLPATADGVLSTTAHHCT